MVVKDWKISWLIGWLSLIKSFGKVILMIGGLTLVNLMIRISIMVLLLPKKVWQKIENCKFYNSMLNTVVSALCDYFGLDYSDYNKWMIT